MGAALAFLVTWSAAAGYVAAADFRADPASYADLLARLRPGDRLLLTSGTYRSGLRLHGVNGAPGNPIVVSGPETGPPAVFLGREGRNTVSLRTASHLVVRSVVLDGRGLQADGVNAERNGGVVHHITLERLTIIGHGADQQIVGISTQTPAAFWTIRNNVIIGAGSGLYLGSSNGSAPFVAGVIEGNTIINSIGYNLQIKHQQARPASPEMPAGPQQTIIRGNYFSKAKGASAGELARPNLLVGHFPLNGAGSDDEYFISENVFYANPTEALFQGEGNVTLVRNAFLNPFGGGIVIRPHKDRPRRVQIAENFVSTLSAGIFLEGVAPEYTPRAPNNIVVEAASAKDATRARSNGARGFREWVNREMHDAGHGRWPSRHLADAVSRACDPRRLPPVAAVGASGLVPATDAMCRWLRAKN